MGLVLWLCHKSSPGSEELMCVEAGHGPVTKHTWPCLCWRCAKLTWCTGREAVLLLLPKGNEPAGQAGSPGRAAAAWRGESHIPDASLSVSAQPAAGQIITGNKVS